MNVVRLLLATLGIVCFATHGEAQQGRKPAKLDYSSLIKAIEQAERKDLPQTVATLADSMRRGAEREQAFVPLMLGTYSYYEGLEDINDEASDSLFLDLHRLSKLSWLKPHERVVLATMRFEAYEDRRGDVHPNDEVAGLRDSIMPSRWGDAQYASMALSLLDQIFADPTALAVDGRPYEKLLNYSKWSDSTPQSHSLMRYIVRSMASVRTRDPELHARIRDGLMRYRASTDKPLEHLLVDASLVSDFQPRDVSRHQLLAEVVERYRTLPEVCQYVPEVVGYWEVALGWRKALDQLDYYIKAYGEHPVVNAKSLTNAKRQLLRPSLSTTDTTNYYILGRRQELIHLRSRLISSVHVQVYRVPSVIDVDQIWVPQEGVKPLRELTWEVPLDDLQAIDTLRIPIDFPTTGQYYIRLSGQPHRLAIKGDADCRQHLSRMVSDHLAFAVRTGGDRVQQYWVNALTGQPLAGRSIKVSKTSWQDNKPETTTQQLKTSTQGDITLHQGADLGRYIVQTQILDTQDPLTTKMRWGHSYGSEPRLTEDLALLTTDRGAYQPGQQVHLYGIAYRIGRHAEQAQVLAEQALNLELRTPDYSVALDTVIKTDRQGRFVYQYTLPTEGQLGRYTALVAPEEGTTALRMAHYTFNVAEYKRPQFEVLVEAPKHTPSIGDSIELGILVRELSGAPLAGVSLSCEVGLYQYRGWQSQDRSYEVRLTTDAQGRAKLPISLKPIEQVSREPLLAMRCSVQAVATSSTGEVQRGRYRFLAGEALKAIGLELPTFVDRSAQHHTMRFTAESHEGGTRADSVRYEIRYGTALVASGTDLVGRELELGDWVRTARSGAYTIAYEALPATRQVRGERRIWLYDPRDRSIDMGELPLALFSPDSTYSPHRQPRVLWSAGAQESHVFYHVVGDTQVLASGLMRGRRGLLQELSLPRIPDEVETLEVRLYTVRDSRLYSEQITLRREQPDKALELRWSTFRNRLRAGTQETWRLKVLHRGQPISTSVASWMYDAAVDAISPLDMHVPQRRIYTPIKELAVAPLSTDRLAPDLRRRSPFAWSRSDYTDPRDNRLNLYEVSEMADTPFMYRIKRAQGASLRGGTTIAEDAALEEMVYGLGGSPGAAKMMVVGAPQLQALSESEASSMLSEVVVRESTPNVRRNFRELAYFYPRLESDASGEAVWSFDLPETLTRWRVEVLAHTPQMDYGRRTDYVESYRELQVVPYLPRFMRLGDKTTITSSVRNLSEARQAGDLQLELFDLGSDSVLLRMAQPFTLEAQQTASFAFEVEPPRLDSIGVRFVAQTAEFSDGEQHALPVLPDTEETVRSLAFTLTQAGLHRLDLSPLFPSTGYRPEAGTLTIQLESNPLYLALLALPDLAREDEHDAISLASSIYSLRLAHYLSSTPGLIEWVRQRAHDVGKGLRADRDAVLIDKSARTPWQRHLEAEREATRLQALLLLLERDHEEAEARLVKRLAELQSGRGHIAWFAGMQGSRYLTHHVLRLLVRSQSLVPYAQATATASLQRRAWEAVEASINEEIARTKEYEAKTKRQTTGISSLALDYLYLRVLDQRTSPKEAYAFLEPRLRKTVHSLSLEDKALATRIYAQSHPTIAQTLLQSLREHLTYGEEGAYFYYDWSRRYWWSTRSYSTQVHALEAFVALTPSDDRTIVGMQQWILAQKRGVRWESPVATVEAIYALTLGKARAQMTQTTTTQARLLSHGGKQVEWQGTRQGFTTSFGRTDYPEALELTPSTDAQVWSAASARYELPIAKQTASGRQLRAERRYFVRRMVGTESKLFPVVEGQQLHKGDRLVTQLYIQLERDLDFVRLSDPRLGCAEPVESTARYMWGGGTSYYVEPRHSETRFYFDYLSRGEYRLEYEQSIVRSGVFQAPSAHLQSVYAPEYTATTGFGGRISVAP